ncbi:M23 family metallopeptidase [Micromonospora sp. PLK6-60]|uniref:murein hydrolase activator EnvC family protein n=1 Tax=Micromonospora sp. PLK6-60 TaxID=2873383 RepID=UPI001CA74540|nr:M23 family metallopeptidase [Micromonospora sp. PLK6-60]
MRSPLPVPAAPDPAAETPAPAVPDPAAETPAPAVPGPAAETPPPGVRGPAAVPRPGGGTSERLVFRWPLDGPPRPVRRFAPPPQPWLAGHRGVDLAAVPGGTVRAAGPGVVLFAGQVAGRPVVTVGHRAGLRTTYEPVSATLRAGEPVAAGSVLGIVLPGHPGCPAPACLHWGLRRGEEYLDPLALVGAGPVRLLPIASMTAGPG